ncbi:MAG: TspO/MBR family protein [Hyphomicrobiales bacterium]
MSQGVAPRNIKGDRRWLVLAFWFAVVAVVAIAGSWVTLPKIPTWYAGLNKPSFTPPNAVFGPAWTILYTMMAVAVWRIGAPSDPARRRAVTLFAVQLAFNAVWSPVFFGLQAPKLGLVVVAGLLVSLAATFIAFWRIDRWAGGLLVPYLAWVCYATSLNAAIVASN